MERMTVEQLIEVFTTEEGFQCGIENVIKAVRPGALYSVSMSGGEITVVDWDSQNEGLPPTSQELRDEYIRFQTIREFMDYLKKNVIVEK
jgi:hypothetical protein